MSKSKPWMPTSVGMTNFVNGLASVELTLFCLGLMMMLVFFGTIAQVHVGTYAAQKQYFYSVWVYAFVGDWKIPFFPGGLLVGALWFANLLAAFVVRFRWEGKALGILISHGGLVLLLLGQFLTQTLAHERQMPLDVGETRSFSEDARDFEIVLVRTRDAQTDEVTSIPYSLFSRRRVIAIPGKTISLAIRQWFPNAQLGMAGQGQPSLATQGIGPRIQVAELPLATTDEETNQVTAYVEVLDAGQSLGIWLLSAGLGAPQTFTSGGDTYRIALRLRRTYHPFALTLKEFRHDTYAGTDIPKNFSSVVHITGPGEASRDALIYMNHPLRYGGLTFYQASFGKGDQQSIFQVVRNPAWLVPYISCALMVLGLLLQFGWHLAVFIKRGTRDE